MTSVYTWDLENRLESIDSNGDGTPDVSYTYNSDGVRVSETIAAGTTYFLNDPQNPTGYDKAVEERTDANGDGQAETVARACIFGLQVIAQKSGSDLLILVQDGHGSTRLLLTLPGLIDQHLDYNAFGKLLNLALNQAKTNWQFGGDGIVDPHSGLTNHIRRWREGARFISRDPLETAGATDPTVLHKYLYAGANPVAFGDVTGLFSVTDVLGSQFIKNLVRFGGEAYKMYEVYDKFSTIREMAKIISLAVRGAAFDPVAAGLLMLEFLPLGGIASKIGKTFRYVKVGRIAAKAVDGGEEALEELNKVYRAAKGVGNAGDAGELLGTQAASLVAGMKGFKATPIKAKYRGIDGIFKDEFDNWVVVEAKGAGGALVGNQMSQQWLKDRLPALLKKEINADVPQSVREELLSALNAGKVKGMVVKAPVNAATGAVESIDFELRDWVEIGDDIW